MWLATLAADLPVDTQQRQKPPPRPRTVRTPINSTRHFSQPHVINDSGGVLRCEVCALHVSAYASPACRRVFLGSKCKGSVTDRALTNGAEGKKHKLYVSGEVTWCFDCGHYSSKRANGLVKRECAGRPSSVGVGVSLKRLKNGKHPKHPDIWLPNARALG